MLAMSREEILPIINSWRNENLKIGFTSGVFDLLHVGHVRYLEEAKKHCDKLVVAVNKDKSVKKNKGSKRPIIKDKERIKIVANLKMVDLAFLFDEPNNNANISTLKPDFYFKSKQYSPEQLSSKSLMEEIGGETILLEHVKGSSTSNIIHKILVDYAHERPLMERLTLKKKSAVFLDRDGVINQEVEYLHEESEFKILPNVYLGLKKLLDHDFKLIVVTTQAGIGLGYFKKSDFFKVNKKMLTLLHKKNIVLDKVYFCPHSKNDECRCRKPETLLFERASIESNLDLRTSYVIGDKTSDIKAGENLGLGTILVKTGHGGKDGQYSVKPDFVADNLDQAAEWIIAHKH